MIRVIWFLIKVSLFVLIAAWFAEYPGRVQFEWHGYIVETYIGILVLAVILAVWFSSFVFEILAKIFKSPAKISDWYDERKLSSGYKALTQGMVAVAAGDADAALKLSRKAQALLNDPPLTLLLTAQAAQLNGNEKVAEKYFREMLAFPEMSFLGIRGLLTQSLKNEDEKGALLLAREASLAKKKSPWVSQILFELECRASHWHEALMAFEDYRKNKDLSKEVWHKQKAVILTEIAKAEHAESDVKAIISSDVLKKVSQAISFAPYYAPVVLAYVKFHHQAVKIRQAVKAIEKCYEEAPNALLIEAYLDLRDKGNNSAQLQHLERLVALAEPCLAGHFALAELYMKAGIWGQARDHLASSQRFEPTKRVYLLYAELEKKQYQNDESAEQWLMKAASAPDDPLWHCASCHYEADAYQAICPNCHHFDEFIYETPRLRPLDKETIALEE